MNRRVGTEGAAERRPETGATSAPRSVAAGKYGGRICTSVAILVVGARTGWPGPEFQARDLPCDVWCLPRARSASAVCMSVLGRAARLRVSYM